MLVERRDAAARWRRRGRARLRPGTLSSSASSTARACGAVLREHVALADVLGPLAAGERRLVEGDVADEVERIEVLAHFLGERIERQALGFQFLDDRLLALGSPSSA